MNEAVLFTNIDRATYFRVLKEVLGYRALSRNAIASALKIYKTDFVLVDKVFFSFPKSLYTGDNELRVVMSALTLPYNFLLIGT